MANRHHSKRWVLVPELGNVSKGQKVKLSESKRKHLLTVLRLQTGTVVRMINGQGRLYEGLIEINREYGLIEIRELLLEKEKGPETELAICLPKNSSMDWLVEKAVECGVTKITPIISSRTVVRPSAKHVERWRAIMDGAVEQSEQVWRPELVAPREWKEWVAHERSEKAERLKYAFVSELRKLSQGVNLSWGAIQGVGEQSACVVIGPEGGFADSEVSDLKDIGAKLVSLDGSVLRVETAVVVALTMLNIARLS